MRTFAFILFVAFSCICFGDTSKPLAPITKTERAAIEAVIKKVTAEKILAITREPSDTVEVRTGVVTPGKLDGKGQTFTLKHTKKGWEIQKRGLWVS
ncbi:MAG: hypothetical protein ABIQ35_05895 [Verrucomicrobiota bacterium]